ncbi:MAG: hypothetical protein ACRD2U_09045 [Terriglobales bacterium]
MADVIPDAHQEFWRPPVTGSVVVSDRAALIGSRNSAESCPDCHTEFMPGSRFCYLCGANRTRVEKSAAWKWKKILGFLRVLGFQHIKQGLGLPLASLAGLLIGFGCLIAAVAVGRISPIQSVAEFQAVQLLRIEWLLGAVTAFLAAILLKGAGQRE